jgi:nicotinamide-nucleotide amidase
MFTSDLTDLAHQAGTLLRERDHTIAVAEGSAGGLISASLLSIPGASSYYLGGTVIYTLAANKALLADALEVPAGMRGATEQFAQYLAEAMALRLGATWGIGEAGAAGPPNRYGDPSGHAWVAVANRETNTVSTRHILTGLDKRVDNMVAFATAALQLLVETVLSPSQT